jgi:hypothetical protein
VWLQEASGAEKRNERELEGQCHFEDSPDPALRNRLAIGIVASNDSGVASLFDRRWTRVAFHARICICIAIRCLLAFAGK